MIQHILNHFPDYMDDRTSFTIVLSDDLKYRNYSLAASNTVSSWYDPSQDRAFTTTTIDDVPTELRSNLIQHNSAPGTAVLMYPKPTPSIDIANSSKIFSLPNKPAFTGESFKIFWDVYNDPTAVSSYDSASLLSEMRHQYDSYGEHTIKFSSNVTGIQLTTRFDRIKEINSRSSNFQSLTYVYFCRNLERMKLNTLSCIDTEWYDCYELTSLELPELEDIARAYSVNCMHNLKHFSAPRLKRISEATGVFKGNIKLEAVYFPQLTAIYGGSGYTFMTNVELSSAYCPKLVSCLPTEFAYCVNLKETNFSSLEIVSDGMFRDCLSLKELKFPKVKKIGSSAFHRCQNLKTIDLSGVKEQVPTLAHTNAFTGLPNDYEVLVYGPLMSKYKEVTNWRLIGSHLKAV